MLPKKSIVDQLKLFIYECDNIVSSVVSCLDRDGLLFSNSLYFVAEKIRTEYIEYSNNVFNYIQKNNLGIGKELIFRPQVIRKIFLGGGYIDEDKIPAILIEIKDCLLSSRKELIKIVEQRINEREVFSLNKNKIKFIENPPAIMIGGEKVELVSGSKELDVCKFLFLKPIKKEFSWDEPFGDDMEGVDRKCAEDAVRRINKKVQKITGDKSELIKCKRKMISRLF